MEYTEEEIAVIKKAKQGGFELSPGQINFRRDKIKEIKSDFNQEYPEDIITAFLTTGGSVFGNNIEKFLVDSYFDMEEEDRMAHIRYAGIDWGQDDDYACLSIADRQLNREVFMGRWRKEDWDVIRREMRKHLYYWNAQYIRPERNSMGSSQIFELAKEMEKDKFEFEIRPVVMNNPIKKELVLFFRDGLHDHGYKVMDSDYGNMEMKTFVTKRTASGLYNYEVIGDGKDDTVITRMLGYAGMFSFDE